MRPSSTLPPDDENMPPQENAPPQESAPRATHTSLLARILGLLATRTEAELASLSPHHRFQRLGLDSIGATSILEELSRDLSRTLSPTLIWEHPTPDALARHLSGEASEGAEGAEGRGEATTRIDGEREPIAIIGMACRLPGAQDLAAYWELLSEGRDAITEVPSDRWDADAYYDADPTVPGKMKSRRGGFIADVVGFDPGFFGISPREAKELDPQQRLALELSWEALEDAGVAPAKLRESRTGVFFGAMWDDYAKLIAGSSEAIVQHTATGQNPSIIPARISYTLGLNGPSFVVNTACSSSLVATHLAIHSLQRGESSLCLVGGVNLMLSPESSLAMAKFGGLSPDGRSRAFDARANGYVRGEGGGVVVLKPLSRALADGDRIYCLLRGSAVNNDGFSNGLTAPSPRAQEAVLRDAYATAGVEPREVEYVEAHGTGTMLGDPIEANALGAVFAPGRAPERPLRVGSVKTNIGHLEAAAGIAGLIKVALSISRGSIPQSLHFETANPHIDFDALKIEVQTEQEPWKSRDGRALAGISSFGFGGTNCHLVLEGREPERRPPIAFVFGGHGAQWRGMGRALLAEEPAAREALRRCDRALKPYLGWSLIEGIESGEEALFDRVDFVQPATFALQVALAEAWRARGIVPDAVVGQSIGEVAAAHIAGALSLDDAARVIAQSSARIAARAAGRGGTAVLGISREAAAELIAPAGASLSIAGVSAPELTLVAGDEQALTKLAERAGKHGVFFRRARMDYASHSPHVESLLPAFARDLEPIEARPAAITFISTVTGGPAADDATPLDATYWQRNLRDPALLGPALAELARRGFDVFVEVSPHAVLSRAITDSVAAAGRHAQVVPSALRGEPEPEILRDSERTLYDGGVVGRPREQAPAQAQERAAQDPALILLSAKSDAALSAQAERLRAHLETRPELALGDLARSLAIGREAMPYRLSLTASSREELLGGLARAAKGDVPPRGERGRARSTAPKIAFLFTGQGAQRLGAGRALYGRWPAFREAFDRCLELFDPALPRPLRAVMWAEEGSPDAALLDRTDFTQPALFALEYALHALWRSWGVCPDLLIGHSIGELVAACVAGVFSLADATRLVAARGALMQALPEGGAMASIAAPEPELAAAIEAHTGELSIAAVNSPGQVVISGARRAVDEVVASFSQRGVRTRKLRVSHAFHSPLMEPMLEAFGEVATTITYRQPSIPLVSNVSGELAADAPCSPEYWVRHVREAVRFVDGAQALRRAGAEVFVELGPRATLTGLVAAALPDEELALYPTLQRKREETESALAALGGIVCKGGEAEWTGIFGHTRSRVDLPTYPWQRSPYWRGEGSLRTPSSPAERSLYRTAWIERPRPLADLSHEPAGAWLALADADSGSERLTAELAAHGCELTVLPLSADEEALRSAFAGRTSWRGVVLLSELSPHDGADLPTSAAEVVATACRALAPLPALARLLGEAKEPPPLWIVTRGACEADLEADVRPIQAALWGMGRVFALEHPEAWGGLIDLDPSRPITDGVAAALLRELLAPDSEDQLALRGDRRLAQRLVRACADGPAPPVTIRAEGTYLLTGGLGSIGLQLATWLVKEGARHLLLTGRRGLDTPGAAEAIAALRARGAEIEVAAVDVADGRAMEELLSALEPPLRGVFHVAGVGPHAPLAETDGALLAQTLAPKVAGGWALHQLSTNPSVELFVSFASGAGVWGGVHQGAYAAANAFLDGLAHHRHARGMPALSVAWGMWSESGMADPESLAELATIGVLGMPSERAFAALGGLLRGGAVQRTATRMEWRLFAPIYASRPRRMLLSELAPAEQAPADPGESSAETTRWLNASPQELRPQLREEIRGAVAEVLGFDDPSSVDDEAGFAEQGLDSLMAGTLRLRLQRALGVSLSSTVAFDHPTILRLTEHLLADVLQLEKLEKASAPATLADHVIDEPIAVIGVACRFPHADDPESYWELLERGEIVVDEVPEGRWRPEDYFDPDPEAAGRSYVKVGGFLSGIEDFEPTFFRISPREAATLDPQQRLMLEVTWEALERAGEDPTGLRGSATGVFVGVGPNEYAERLEGLSDPGIVQYGATGSPVSFASGRVSFVLGLQGPSLAIDTACSSSLVALHLACQSLRSGECERAIAGGVNVLASPRSFVAMSKIRALSTDGRCKTFGADADGYGRAEGCGVVILKRLSDAERAGDRILGLIRGSAVNHDGPSSGLTVPNGPAQQALLRAAVAGAGVAPESVDFVECHGTGTSLGDPIEVQALAAVYGHERPEAHPLVVGAAKANLGHLEPASGMAGLLKLLLMFEHGAIPGQPGLGELNPHVDWEDLPVVVPRESRPWPRHESRPRRAAVSGFGLSGTNAHLVLEEPPAPPPKVNAPTRAAELLVLSARTDAALADQAGRLAAHLRGEPELALGEVARSLATTRSALQHRLALTASDTEAAIDALTLTARGEPPPGVSRQRSSTTGTPRVVLVFPGQGSQWIGMGRALLRDEPSFRAAMQACDAAILAESGFSVIEELQRPEESSRLAAIDLIQPTLFAMQVALAATWRSWGIEPAAVVGHSMGEVAAAHVAGALSLADATAIICRRSRLLLRVSGEGAMALVELSLDEAEQALVGREDRLSVAVSNSPRSTVISGEPAALELLLGELERAGTFCRRVKVDVASHSPQMDPLREDLLAALEGLAPRASALPIRSTVRGDWVEGSALTPEYWVDNLRAPVRFGDAVRTLSEGGPILFLEVSPHPILVPSIEEILSDGAFDGAAVGSLRRGREELACLLESLGALWTRGAAVAWSGLYAEGDGRVLLPTYPWQRERFWIDRPRGRGSATSSREHRGGHPLLGTASVPATQPSMRIWETTLDLERLPWLGDHRVQGAILLPGTAYLEMALSAAAKLATGSRWQVAEIALLEALGFAEGVGAAMQVVVDEEEPGRARLQISSFAEKDGSAPSRTHVRGILRRSLAPAPEPLSTDALRSVQGRLREHLSGDEVYAELATLGLEYGPAFRGIHELQRGDGEALGRVQPGEAAGPLGPYIAHPAVLDACFQVAASALGGRELATPWIPVGVEAIELHAPLTGELLCHATIRGGEAPELQRADLQVMTPKGEPVAVIAGLALRRLADSIDDSEEDERFIELDWEQAPTPKPAITTGRWLILGADDRLGAGLTAALERAGQQVVHAAPSDHGDLPRGVRAFNARSLDAHIALLRGAFGGAPPTAVIHIGSLDASHDADRTPTAESVEAALLRGTDGALVAAQALAAAGFRDTPRLWLVTRGAEAVAKSAIDVGQSPITGLARVIALEHAELRCSHLDLDPTAPPDEVDALIAELRGDEVEQQVALRGGSRWVARLAHRSPSSGKRESLEPANGRPYRLEIDAPGVLERLTLRPMQRRSPGPGQVEIAVEAAGLNFLDVLLALGVMPDDVSREPGTPTPLGAECAGRIVALGEGVDGLRVGEPVLALARGSFASHVIASADLVAPRPASLSAVDAAAMPTTFLTAWYALDKVARLEPGERVLIHAATGGVGLAAVQWAQHRGAEIYATAGTPEKHAFLRSLGVEHISDSRSDSFVADVLEWTDGEGVDVVLNSLSGALIERSFSLLRAYGRFVELGKRDYYANNQLGLRPFLRNLSFSLVDLRGMMLERPAKVRRLLQELLDQIASGALRPPPIETFPLSRAADAFHHMAQARHIGKLVLTSEESVSLRVPATGASIRADGSYLITGGTGGLGLRTATLLAEKGAGHLLLVGRTGARRPEQAEAVEVLRAAGCEVTVAAADVSDRAALEGAVNAALVDRPPLRGVIHAAGLLDDGMLPQQSPERLRTVMAPKIFGALHLDAITADAPLDFFVMYSAGAGLLGSPGQSNYAAANTFLDALAHRRVADGRPALSIDWGAFAEVGLAAAQAQRGARLAARGMRSLLPDEGMEALERLLGAAENPPQIGVIPLDVRQWIEFYPAAAGSPFLSRLLSAQRDRASAPKGDHAIAERLADARPEERARLLETILQAQACQVLRVPAAELDVHAPLTSLGLDSLMGLELRNRVEQTLGVKVPATLLWTYPTVSALAAHLCAGMALDPAEDRADANSDTNVDTDTSVDRDSDADADAAEAFDADADDIEDMSEDELTRLIEEEFEALE